MWPIIYMLVSVAIWAFFPILGALRAETTPVEAFIAAGWLQGFIAASALAILLQIRRHGKKAFHQIRTVRRSTLALIAAAAAANVASHLLLFTSFTLINKAASTAIYETWPLLVALTIPAILGNRVARITPIELLYGLVGFVGLVVLSYDVSLGTSLTSAEGAMPSKGENWSLGLGLALLASLCQALGTSLYAKTVDRTRHLGGSVDRIAFLQACYCLTGCIIATAYGIATGNNDPLLMFEFGDATVYGVLVLLLGNVFFFLALDTSDRPTIVLLWYLTPIITLVIMFGLGIAAFTIAIVLGAALIIISNILTNFPAERSLVYGITMLAIGLSAGLTFSFDLVRIDTDLDLIAIPAGIFAIIGAFLIDRAQQNKNNRADMALDLLENLAMESGISKEQRTALAGNILISIRETSSPKATQILRDSFKEVPAEFAELKMRFAKFAVQGQRAATFSELLVLVTIGLSTVILAQFVAPETLVGDLFVISITISIVFLCGAVIDRSDVAAERTIVAFIGEYFELPVAKRRPRHSKLSIALTFLLLALYIGGVVAKYA